MEDITLRMLRLKQHGYCCPQIMVLLALENQGKTDPGLVRAMAGLGFGVAMSGEVCGAFTGGACLLSLYTAKGREGEEKDPRHPAMMAELAEWFKVTTSPCFGGMRCENILAKHPDYSACSTLVAATYDQVIKILKVNGIDPCRGRDD